MFVYLKKKNAFIYLHIYFTEFENYLKNKIYVKMVYFISI